MIRLRQFGSGLAACLVAFVGNGLPASAALRLEIVRGDGSNNHAARATSVSPGVRVLDGEGKPVAGALVVFMPPREGASVVFAGYDAEAAVVTDGSGIGVAPRVRPSRANGPVEIRIVANHAGEFAHGIVHQMNLGVGDDSDRRAELDVAPAGEAAPQRKRSVDFEFPVRVQDGDGKPVPGATVLFVLRRINGSKAEELSRISLAADERGEARGPVPKQLNKGQLEFVVQATQGERRATRFFRVD